jgi:serine/threonine protein kinase/Flp pilus assembly protein TadD
MNQLESIEQLEKLFHHALTLAPEAYARFIAQLRASDVQLGAAVESLVAAHKETNHLVDTPAYAVVSSLLAKAQAENLTGRSIDHYAVLELLGKGGMGEVYRARDTKLNRDVALKVLPAAFASNAERLARFEREAQVLAALNHPNIAAIYDLVLCEGKQVLVLELVEGETLADHLEPGHPLPLTEALAIALQIAEALRAAHKKSIVHRDLKPANIKITPDGQVKVLDFGLAKQFRLESNKSMSQAAKAMASVTIPGVIVGTPAYMSPEQAAGEATDIRSDIFSFGVVLYEMLTGRRAFSGNSIATLLQAVLSVNPLSPRRLRKGIPVALDAAIMQALQKDKGQRQPNMESLCSELGRLNAKASISSGLMSSTVEPLRNLRWNLRAWGTDNRKKILATAVLLVIATVSVFGWLALKWRAASKSTLAVASPRVNTDAGTFELFQQGVAYLERYDREENIETAFQAFNAALAKDQNYAPAYAGLGLAYVARFQTNRDKHLLDLAVENAGQAVKLDNHLAINHISLGRAYAERGDYDLAEAELQEARILDPLNPSVYRGLADTQGARRNWAEAERLYKQAIGFRADDWDLHFSLGNLYYRLARYAEAEKAYLEVIRLVPDSHVGYRNLGGVYHMQGRFAEASGQYQKALQIKSSASTYSNLGTSLFFQGLYQQSVTAFEEAIKLGANDYQIWANLGDAYRQTAGHEADARDAFLAAIRLVGDELSAAPDDGDLRSQLALYRAKIGDQQEALEQAARAEKLDQTAPVLATLALVYELCGHREQALTALAAALKAGYSLEEFSRDPELLAMRKDPNYHRLVVRFSGESHH